MNPVNNLPDDQSLAQRRSNVGASVFCKTAKQSFFFFFFFEMIKATSAHRQIAPWNSSWNSMLPVIVAAPEAMP